MGPPSGYAVWRHIPGGSRLTHTILPGSSKSFLKTMRQIRGQERKGIWASLQELAAAF
jgi:hypothetical protein